MTVRELVAHLQEYDPDALVISGIWNGKADTYCAVDHVHQFTLEEILNDFFGTPGATDDRVFLSHADNVVYIGTTFTYNEELIRDKHKAE